MAGTTVTVVSKIATETSQWIEEINYLLSNPVFVLFAAVGVLIIWKLYKDGAILNYFRMKKGLEPIVKNNWATKQDVSDLHERIDKAAENGKVEHGKIESRMDELGKSIQEVKDANIEINVKLDLLLKGRELRLDK